MDFNTSLLSARSLSLEALGVWIVMYHHANPSGEVSATKEELRQAYGRIFHKRATKTLIENALQELIESRLILSAAAIYPIAGEGKRDELSEAKQAIKALEQRRTPEVRPDRGAQENQQRAFAALKTCNVIEAGIKDKREPLEDERGEVVTVAGARLYYKGVTWDYGLITKWITQAGGIDNFCKTLAKLYMQGQFDTVHFMPSSEWQKKRDISRAIISAGLAKKAPERQRSTFGEL